jgi:hypothetical protein
MDREALRAAPGEVHNSPVDLQPNATRFSDDGKVACPWTDRDVEVDQCLACPELRGIRQAKGTMVISCKGPDRVFLWERLPGVF